MSTQKIFIAPRSGEQSSENFKKTIEGGYKKSDILQYLSNDDKSALKEHTTLMIWGNKPSLKSRWEKMDPDDWVLFYQHGKITYAGKLLYKTHNKKLADALWGPQRSENGELTSWEYVFFLRDVKKTDIKYKLMSDLAGYHGSVVQGFLPYSVDGTNKIINKYGSIEKFLFNINKPMNNEENFLYNNFYKSVLATNYFLNKNYITRFISSLLTKPFVILTGLSGSGKTKLAQAFAKWICEEESQYCLVPVGADWTNREPLLGFPNALKANDYVKPDNKVLDLIIAANKNQDKPYFLILDEMNLSHVERYFADFLSVMESKENISLHSGSSEWNGVPSQIGFPKNLFIVGTVNIDETTYMFSPKVLDRASVIEFRVTAAEMEEYLQSNSSVNLDNLEAEGSSMAQSFVGIAKDKTIEAENPEVLNVTLLKFFSELKKTGAEFGYRSASEILRFAAVVKKLEAGWAQNEIADAAIMQKLLPKVHGSRRKLEPVLRTLGALCLNDATDIETLIAKTEMTEEEKQKIKYPISFEKIQRMYQNLISNGFTSYAEA